MQVLLKDLEKKYKSNKLFRGLNWTFESNEVYAITGGNGSGKSSLIKIIAGIDTPTKGEVNYIENQKLIPKEGMHENISICAPYLDLIEEFNLKEQLEFHSKFRQLRKGEDPEMEFQKARIDTGFQKPLREFSSGMKQKVKLILSCCFESNLLLLDEPCSHLDQAGIEWYKSLLRRVSDQRITIIASNDPLEYNEFVKKIVNIEDYKSL